MDKGKKSRRKLPRTSRVNEKIQDYFIKFGYSRDLDKFMRLYSPGGSHKSCYNSTSTSTTTTTASAGAISSSNEDLGIVMQQMFHGSDNEYDFDVEITTSFPEGHMKKLNQISSTQSESNKNKITDKDNTPDEELKTPPRATQTKETQTPESVLKSHKRLEWDSLGDVGYVKSMSTSNVSELERSLLKDYKPENLNRKSIHKISSNASESDIRREKSIQTVEESTRGYGTPPLACSTITETMSLGSRRAISSGSIEQRKLVSRSTEITPTLTKPSEKSSQTTFKAAKENVSQVSPIVIKGAKQKKQQKGEEQLPLKVPSPSYSTSCMGSSVTPSSFEYYSSQSSRSAGQSVNFAFDTEENEANPENYDLPQFLINTITESISNSGRRLSMAKTSADREAEDELKHTLHEAFSENKENPPKINASHLNLGIKLLCSLIDARSLTPTEKKLLVRNIVKRITQVCFSDNDAKSDLSSEALSIPKDGKQDRVVSSKEVKKMDKTKSTKVILKERPLGNNYSTSSRELSKGSEQPAQVEGYNTPPEKLHKNYSKCQISATTSSSSRSNNKDFVNEQLARVEVYQEPSEVEAISSGKGVKSCTKNLRHSERSVNEPERKSSQNHKSLNPKAKRRSSSQESSQVKQKEAHQKHTRISAQQLRLPDEIRVLENEENSRPLSRECLKKLHLYENDESTKNKSKAKGKTLQQKQIQKSFYDLALINANLVNSNKASDKKSRLSGGNVRGDRSTQRTKSTPTSSNDLTTQIAIVSNDSSKNTAASEPSMSEWLNPLTQSEIDYEQQNRMKAMIDAQKSKARKVAKLRKSPSERQNQLLWIQGEIARLENLRQLLLENKSQSTEEEESSREALLAKAEVSDNITAEGKLTASDVTAAWGSMYHGTEHEEEPTQSDPSEQEGEPTQNDPSRETSKEPIYYTVYTDETGRRNESENTGRVEQEQLSSQSKAKHDQLVPKQRSKMDTPEGSPESMGLFVLQRKQEFLQNYSEKRKNLKERAQKQQERLKETKSAPPQHERHERSRETGGGNPLNMEEEGHYSVPHTMQRIYPMHWHHMVPSNPPPAAPCPAGQSQALRNNKGKTIVRVIYRTGNKEDSREQGAQTTSSSSAVLTTSEMSVPMGSANSSASLTTTHQYDDVAGGGVVTVPEAVELKMPKQTEVKNISRAKRQGFSYYLKLESHRNEEELLKENLAPKSPTLKDYLAKARPDFLARANERVLTLYKMQQLRQQRAREVREIVENTSMNSLERKLEDLAPPPRRFLRLFHTKEMRAMTTKRCKYLSEVVQKKEREREEKRRRGYRLMRDIFSRRLQRQARKGRLSMNFSRTVI